MISDASHMTFEHADLEAAKDLLEFVPVVLIHFALSCTVFSVDLPHLVTVTCLSRHTDMI